MEFLRHFMSGAHRAQYMRKFGGVLGEDFFDLNNLKGMSTDEILMMLPQKVVNEYRANKWTRDDLLKRLLTKKNQKKIIAQKEREDRRKADVRMKESKRPREPQLRKDDSVPDKKRRVQSFDPRMAQLQEKLQKAEAELKKQMEEKTQPNTQLEEQLRVAGVEQQKMLAEREQQKAAHQQLQQQFSNLEHKATGQQTELTEAQRKFEEMQQLHAQGQTEIQSLAAKYEGLQQVSGQDKNQLSELAKQIEANAAQRQQQTDAYTTKMSSLEAERAKEQEQHTRLAEELERKKVDTHERNVELGRRARLIDSLEEQMMAGEEKFQDVESRLQEQEVREAEQFSFAKEQEKKLKESEKARKGLETQMGQLEGTHASEKTKLKQEVDQTKAAATQKIGELQQAVQTGAASIQTLQGKLSSTMEQTQQLQTTIQSLEGQRGVSEKKLVEASKKNEALVGQIKTLQGKLQENEQKVEAQKSEITQMRLGAQGDTQQLNDDIKHRLAKIQKLTQERNAMEQKAKSFEQRIQTLSTQAQTLQAEKGAAETKVQSLQEEKTQIETGHKEAVKGLQGQISKAQAQLAKNAQETEQKIAELKKVQEREKAGFQQDIQHLTGDIENRDSKEQDLKAKLQKLYVKKGELEGKLDTLETKFRGANEWRHRFETELTQEKSARKADQVKMEGQLRAKQDEWNTFRTKTATERASMIAAHGRTLKTERDKLNEQQRAWTKARSEFETKMQNVEGTVQQRDRQIAQNQANLQKLQTEAQKKISSLEASKQKDIADLQRRTDQEYSSLQGRYSSLEDAHTNLTQQHTNLGQQHTQLGQRHTQLQQQAAQFGGERKNLRDEVQRLNVQLAQTQQRANLNEGKAHAFLQGLQKFQSDPNQNALRAHLKKLYEDKLKEVGQQFEQEKNVLRMRFADAVGDEHDRVYTKEMKELEKERNGVRDESRHLLQTMQDLVNADGSFDPTKMKAMVDKLLKGDLRSPDRLNKMLSDLREKHRKLEETHQATSARKDELEAHLSDMKVSPQDLVPTKNLEQLLARNPDTTHMFEALLKGQTTNMDLPVPKLSGQTLKDHLSKSPKGLAQSQLDLFKVLSKWRGQLPVPSGLQKQLVRAVAPDTGDDDIQKMYNTLFSHFFHAYQRTVEKNIQIAGTNLQDWSVNTLKKTLSEMDDRAHAEGTARHAMRIAAAEMGVNPRTANGAWKHMTTLVKNLATRFIADPDGYAQYIHKVKAGVDPSIQKLDPQNQIDALKGELKRAREEHKAKMKQQEDDFKEEWKRLSESKPAAGGPDVQIELNRLKNDHESEKQRIRHEFDERKRAFEQREQELEGGRARAEQERDEMRDVRLPMLEDLTRNQDAEIQRLRNELGELQESGQVPDGVIRQYRDRIRELENELRRRDEAGPQEDGDIDAQIAAIRQELLGAIAGLGQSMRQRVATAAPAPVAGPPGPPGPQGAPGAPGPSGGPGYVSRIPSIDASPAIKMAKLLEEKAQEHTKRAIKRRRKNPLGAARKKYMDARKEARAELTKEKANITARIKKDVAKMARGSRTAAKKRKMAALKATWKLFTDKYPHWKKIKTIAQLRKLTETVKTHRLRLK